VRHVAYMPPHPLPADFRARGPARIGYHPMCHNDRQSRA
jgi:hypothetical protein